MSKATPPRPRLPLFKSGKPWLTDPDYEETLALLKILDLGNGEIAQEKARSLASVARDLRARKVKTQR